MPPNMLVSCFTVGLITHFLLLPNKLYFEVSQCLSLCAFTLHLCLWKTSLFIWCCHLLVFIYIKPVLRTELPDIWLDLNYVSASNIVV